MKRLSALRKVAETQSLIVVQVEDRGLTQIPAGTITCIGIGPAPTELIDRVTSQLEIALALDAIEWVTRMFFRVLLV